MENQTPSYGQCFVSLALGLAPFCLLLGIAALFGANTVTSGGQNIYGWGALVVAIILNVILAAVFAGLQKLGYVVLALLRREQNEAQAWQVDPLRRDAMSAMGGKRTLATVRSGDAD